MSDDEVFPCDDTEYGIQLCRAVKSHNCLFDRSVNPTKAETTAAWKAVAKRCSDQVANCRFRWKTLRNNFTRSYKKYGDKSNYHLHSHLLFLIPHLDIPPDDNDSLRFSIDDVNISLSHANNPNISQYSDSERPTPCAAAAADESHITSESLVLKIESNDTLLDKQEPINAVQSEDLNEKAIEQPRHVEFQQNETREEFNTPEARTPSSDRRLRDRKVPKRFMDEDFSVDVVNEKRPRRAMSRRKSVAALALKEFEFERTLSDLPHTPDYENVNGPTYPPCLSEMLSYNTDGDNAEEKQNDPIANVDSFEKNNMVDSFTNTETSAQLVSVGTQSDTVWRSPDDEFLESLKPEMSVMNLRQKVHFKRRVFHALMDVLDDATNFPNDNEIVVGGGASSVSVDFKQTTSRELTLIRELVSLVQAAKCTPEFTVLEPSKVVPTSASSATTIAQLAISHVQAAQNVEKQSTSSGSMMVKMVPVTPLNMPQQTSNASTPVAAGNNTATIIKRQFMPKTIEIAGSKGSTLLTQESETTRRLYRVYPATASVKSFSSTPPRGTQAASTTTTNAILPTTLPRGTQEASTTTNATLPTVSQQRTQTLPNTSQQRTQPSTSSVSLPSTRQQRTQIFTPPQQRTHPFTPPPQRTQQSTPNGTVSISTQQRTPSTPTTNTNLLPTVQQKTQTPIPSITIRSGVKTPLNRSSKAASTTKYNPFQSFIANRDANATNQNSMLPPSPNVMPPANANGITRSNTMSPAHGASGVNQSNISLPTSLANSAAQRGPHKIISRRYSLCGPVSSKNQQMGTPQHRLTNPPYKRVIRTPPPLQKIPHSPKRDEFNSLLHQLPRRVISQHIAAASSTASSPSQSFTSILQLSSPVSLNSVCNEFNQNPPTKYIPAINYNCRPRMSEPLPEPVSLEADPIAADINNAIDYLTPSEASLLEMAGTVAADNFGTIFDVKSIKNEPETEY